MGRSDRFISIAYKLITITAGLIVAIGAFSETLCHFLWWIVIAGFLLLPIIGVIANQKLQVFAGLLLLGIAILAIGLITFSFPVIASPRDVFCVGWMGYAPIDLATIFILFLPSFALLRSSQIFAKERT